MPSVYLNESNELAVVEPNGMYPLAVLMLSMKNTDTGVSVSIDTNNDALLEPILMYPPVNIPADCLNGYADYGDNTVGSLTVACKLCAPYASYYVFWISYLLICISNR